MSGRIVGNGVLRNGTELDLKKIMRVLEGVWDGMIVRVRIGLSENIHNTVTDSLHVSSLYLEMDK